MSRQDYLRLKCAQDRREAERLIAGTAPTPPRSETAQPPGPTAQDQAAIDHRATIEAQESVARGAHRRYGVPRHLIPRENDPRRRP